MGIWNVQWNVCLPSDDSSSWIYPVTQEWAQAKTFPRKLLCLFKCSKKYLNEAWKPHGIPGEGYFERGHHSALNHLCSDVNVATAEHELSPFRTPFGWVNHDAVPILYICVSESELDLPLAVGWFQFAIVDRELFFWWNWLPSYCSLRPSLSIMVNTTCTLLPPPAPFFWSQ